MEQYLYVICQCTRCVFENVIMLSAENCCQSYLRHKELQKGNLIVNEGLDGTLGANRLTTLSMSISMFLSMFNTAKLALKTSPKQRAAII